MSVDIFEKFAKLRVKYPDDMAQLEAEQKRVSAMLQRKEFAEQPAMQELLTLCRTDIVWARKKLATERYMADDVRTDLWTVVDARSWLLQQLAIDYNTQLALIDTDLETQLAA